MEPNEPPGRPPRRPWGVTLVGLFYLVLGAHALMFGGYLATLMPSSAPSVPFADFLAGNPGIVRAYGLALLGIAAAFLAVGFLVLRGHPRAHWAVLAVATLHIVGPPFALGGVLYAALVTTYLFGSPAAARFREVRPAPA